MSLPGFCILVFFFFFSTNGINIFVIPPQDIYVELIRTALVSMENKQKKYLQVFSNLFTKTYVVGNH